MNTHTTYCDHCQKEVSFIVTPSSAHGGQANLPEGGQLVCLDFGRSCDGNICPLSGLPPMVMGVRLAMSGEEPTEEMESVHGVCESCGFPTELAVINERQGVCRVCGSVNRLVLLKPDDGSYVAATGSEPDQQAGQA